MRVIKPYKLNKGDLIGIITPASPVKDFSRIEKSINYFEKLGYRVELGKNVGKKNGYLAGTDDERANDINEMFSDNKIKAIFCARGGYGSPRILDRIDYKLIKANPKIFVGYSDITALHLAIFQKTGLITFAGPMPAVDFWDVSNPFAEENFWRILSSSKKIGKLQSNEGNEFVFANSRSAEGKLIGGNLSIIISLIGTRFLPSFKNNILFIEDINEPPYRIDRMLNQLRLNSIIKKSSAFLVGQFVDCEEKDDPTNSFKLTEIFSEYLISTDKPVIQNIRHGHIKDNLTLPIGIQAFINGKKGTIKVSESAVL